MVSLSELAAIATAVGVLLAVGQLEFARRQSRASFEESFNGRYRAIIAQIPVEALLGNRLPTAGAAAALSAFYSYFDLCNEQVFLLERGRINPAMWTLWKDGMSSNLRRPAFSDAWEAVSARASEDFDELRGFISEGYEASAPSAWRRIRWIVFPST